MTDLKLPRGITAVTSNGLEAYRIDTPLATGLVHALGAHVAEFTPAGAQPVLWMSGSSFFEQGRAIRGGIPICFPWFGPGRDGQHSPAHGFARLSTWTLVDAEVDDAGQARLVLQLTGDEVAELAGFPADFTARLTVTMGSALNVSLTVLAGNEPLDFEEALHSYFAVGDVRKVRVEGLDGARYLDKVAGGEVTQSGDVKFTAETDRIYFSTATCTIDDPAMGRRIAVAKTGSADTVVWNPWIAKSAAMADFGDAEWPGMCCVETVNCLVDAIRLAPGESHTMAVDVTLA